MTNQNFKCRWQLAVLAAVLLTGCSVEASYSSTPNQPVQRNVGRTSFGSIVAIDDTLRGVTCYSHDVRSLSCVKVKP